MRFIGTPVIHILKAFFTRVKHNLCIYKALYYLRVSQYLG
jgi:hypothetical protein